MITQKVNRQILLKKC